MKAPGDLIAPIVKLSSGVELGHNHFHGRAFLLFMNINGNAAAVIPDGNAVIDMNDHFNFVTVAGQGLIDAVVHQLMDEMVEAFHAGIADIHGGPFANRREPF